MYLRWRFSALPPLMKYTFSVTSLIGLPPSRMSDANCKLWELSPAIWEQHKLKEMLEQLVISAVHVVIDSEETANMWDNYGKSNTTPYPPISWKRSNSLCPCQPPNRLSWNAIRTLAALWQWVRSPHYKTFFCCQLTDLIEAHLMATWKIRCRGLWLGVHSSQRSGPPCNRELEQSLTGCERALDACS